MRADVFRKERIQRFGLSERTRDQQFADKVVPAAQIHAAFMAALEFGYAKLVSTQEYLAAAPAK